MAPGAWPCRAALMLACLSTFTLGSANVTLPEEVLMTDIMEDYNKAVRPALNPAQPVEVSLNLKIKHLREVNSKAQYVSVSGSKQQTWFDPRLMWNPADHAGVTYVVMSPEEVWLPDTVLATAYGAYFDKMHYSFHQPIVHYDGLVFWEPGGQFITSCPMDMTYYPFDEQFCTFKFSPWSNDANKIRLVYNEPPEVKAGNLSVPDVVLGDYTTNDEWVIRDVSAWNQTAHTHCCPGKSKSAVDVQLHLKRRSLYYGLKIIIPTVLLTLLVLSIFSLKPEEGDRISMGVTLVLSFLVFLLLVSDDIPRTSVGVPLLQVYMVCYMLITSLVVLESVMVLHWYHQEATRRPPVLLAKLTLFALGRYLKPSAYNRYSAEAKKGKPAVDVPVISLDTVTSSCETISTSIDDKSATSSSAAVADNSAVETTAPSTQRYSRMNQNTPSATGHVVPDYSEQWHDITIIINRFSALVVLLLFIFTVIIALVLTYLDKPDVFQRGQFGYNWWE